MDKMYKVKYVTLQADLVLSHEISIKPLDKQKEVDITFIINLADVPATHVELLVQFNNVREIVRCKPHCLNASRLNNGIPTVQIPVRATVIRQIRSILEACTVKVDNGVEEIRAQVIISAANMRTKEGTYVIPLKEEGKSV